MIEKRGNHTKIDLENLRINRISIVDSANTKLKGRRINQRGIVEGQSINRNSNTQQKTIAKK